MKLIFVSEIKNKNLIEIKEKAITNKKVNKAGLLNLKFKVLILCLFKNFKNDIKKYIDIVKPNEIRICIINVPGKLSTVVNKANKRVRKENIK